MKKLAHIIFLYLLCMMTSSFATTGNELLKYCEDSDNWSHGYCMGYINGVTGLSHLLIYPGSAMEDCWYNYYKDVTIGQLKKVIIKYLKDDPSKLHQSAEILIALAEKQAFPIPAECIKKE